MILRSLLAIVLGLIFCLSAEAQIPAERPETGKAEWIAQCGNQGGYSACENLADQHLKGLYGVSENRTMTAYYLLKACRYGNFEMCEFAYGMAGTGASNADIRGEAAAWACNLGDPKYCVGAMAELGDEDTVFYSPELVGAVLEKGCDKSHASSCMMLGRWFDKKDRPGVSADPAKALKGYASACYMQPDDSVFDQEDISSVCFMAHRYYSGDEGLPADYSKSKQSLLRSCKYGDEETCAYALSSFHHGINGVTQDNIAALAMADRSCELGYAIACDSAAFIHYKNGDHEKAFDAFAANCDRNPNLYSCAGAAAEAYTAKGPKHASTTQYAKLACDQKDGWSCYLYASNTYYLDQNGNQHLFKKACDFGSKEGCEEVERRKAWEKARDEAIRARTSTLVPSTQTYEAPRSVGNWYKPPTNSYIAAPIKRSYHQQQNYNYSTCMSNRSNWGTC